MVKNSGPKRERRVAAQNAGSAYSNTGRSVKCQMCNNRTRDPSGYCHLHGSKSGGSESLKKKVQAISVQPVIAEVKDRHAQEISSLLEPFGFPPGVSVWENEQGMYWEIPQLPGAAQEFNNMAIVAQSVKALEDMNGGMSVFEDDQVLVGIWNRDDCWIPDDIDVSGIPHERDEYGALIVDQDHVVDAVKALHEGMERRNKRVLESVGVEADIKRAEHGIAPEGVVIAGMKRSHPSHLIDGDEVAIDDLKFIEWYKGDKYYITKFDKANGERYQAQTWDVTDSVNNIRTVSDANLKSRAVVTSFAEAIDHAENSDEIETVYKSSSDWDRLKEEANKEEAIANIERVRLNDIAREFLDETEMGYEFSPGSLRVADDGQSFQATARNSFNLRGEHIDSGDVMTFDRDGNPTQVQRVSRQGRYDGGEVTKL